jgi:GrpB-like predicted nucleotidyltransferase (UPF0157 family)
VSLDEPICLAAHDPRWSEIAAAERLRISKALGFSIDCVEHIGSTAVPQLIAKPIIDLIVGVRSYPPPRKVTEQMVSLGYEALGEAGVSERLYFRRRGVDSFNAHVVLVHGTHWKTTIGVREHLRSEPAERERYERAKIHAVRAGHTMLSSYSKAKSAIVAEFMKRAESAPVQSRTITAKIYREGAMCFIPIAFDPKASFGKVRAPVCVTLNGYTYRSTIAAMGGITCIPLRKSHREAAGLRGGETLAITIALDTAAREVNLPEDLAQSLRSNASRWKKWQALSYTRRREYVEAVEGAKKPETRARRVAGTVQAVDDR